jgi:acyl-homoserine lactone acylase PvdQ
MRKRRKTMVKKVGWQLPTNAFTRKITRISSLAIGPTPERFDRIEALMAATPKHDAASMHKIQADTTSLATQKLLPVVREAKSNHALAGAAQALMKSFDGNMQASSSAPLVFANLGR